MDDQQLALPEAIDGWRLATDLLQPEVPVREGVVGGPEMSVLRVDAAAGAKRGIEVLHAGTRRGDEIDVEQGDVDGPDEGRQGVLEESFVEGAHFGCTECLDATPHRAETPPERTLDEANGSTVEEGEALIVLGDAAEGVEDVEMSSCRTNDEAELRSARTRARAGFDDGEPRSPGEPHDVLGDGQDLAQRVIAAACVRDANERSEQADALSRADRQRCGEEMPHGRPVARDQMPEGLKLSVRSSGSAPHDARLLPPTLRIAALSDDHAVRHGTERVRWHAPELALHGHAPRLTNRRFCYSRPLRIPSGVPMNSPILLPIVTLVAWSLVMWTWMYATRIPAMVRARMKPDRRLPQGEQMRLLPPEVRWKADNYNHLMEQPTIFYAVALSLALGGAAGTLEVGMAWGYVGLRVVHSLVQAIVNVIELRFVVFVLSSILLIGLTGRALATLL